MVRRIAFFSSCVAALVATQHPAVQARETSPALFVANKGEDSLSRIDLVSGEESKRVPSCVNPHELAISPDRRHVALACYGGTDLEIFSTADLSRIKAIELGAEARPHGLVWHDNGNIYSTAQGRGSIFIVEQPMSDDPRLQEIVIGEDGPHMLVVDAGATAAWGTNVPEGEVARVDLVRGEVTHRAQLGGNTEAIALSPDGSALWVGANTDHKAYRLDPATLAVEAEVPTGQMPIRMQVHPDGPYAVTSELRDGTVGVIDTATDSMARTIEVSGAQGGAGQVTLIFSSDGSRIYVAETFASSVAEIDFASGAVLRRLPAGKGGDGLALSE